jgi:hypothetical protein
MLATLGAAASVILAFRSGLSTIEKIAVLLGRDGSRRAAFRGL